MRVIRIMILLLIAVIGLKLSAQAPTPAWVLYEQGKNKMDLQHNGSDPGEALRLFLKALEIQPIYPQVEVAIGDLYVREKNYLLAERQYRKALEQRAGFVVPEELYSIRYKIADLYREQLNYLKMENELLEVLRSQTYYADPSQERFRAAFLASYYDRGLEHTLRLYRLEKMIFALKAHRDLGQYYHQTGRYPQSVLHSLFALDIIVTEVMEEIRSREPDYELISLEPFIERTGKIPEVASFLGESQFFAILYFLASADDAERSSNNVRRIWTILSQTPAAGKWSELAGKRLKAR